MDALNISNEIYYLYVTNIQGTPFANFSRSDY